MSAAAAAILFVWLGMVLAISFLEAPLKFRAPGITIALGLGIGRLVFQALNIVEVLLAGAVVLAAVTTRIPGRLPLTAISVAVAVLAVQLVLVRPRLRRRSDAVLTGQTAAPGGMRERSTAHYAYAGLEVVKVVALLTAAVALQTSLAG